MAAKKRRIKVYSRSYASELFLNLIPMNHIQIQKESRLFTYIKRRKTRHFQVVVVQ